MIPAFQGLLGWSITGRVSCCEIMTLFGEGFVQSVLWLEPTPAIYSVMGW